MTNLTDEAVKALLDDLRKPWTIVEYMRPLLIKGADALETTRAELAKARAEHAASLIRINAEAVEAVAQARADTDAAVALVVERAAQLCWDKQVSHHMQQGYILDDFWHEHGGTHPGMAYVPAIRSLAPAGGLAAVEALRKERDDARRLFLQACEPIAASPDIADVVAAVEEWMNRRGGEDTADQIAIMAIQSYQRAMQPERDRLAADLAASRAREAGLVDAVKAFLWWVDQKCPCQNEELDPCTLCGASVENLEACKAADSTLPRRLLEQIRAALASTPPDTTWHERRTMLPGGG